MSTSTSGKNASPGANRRPPRCNPTRPGYEPIIYAFEDHPQLGIVVRPVFELLEQGQVQAIISTVSIVEVLTAPIRAKNSRLTRSYRRFFREAAGIQIVALSDEIAERAATLRAAHGLATADAIVAATAVESDCQAHLTNDTDLEGIKGIRVLIVQDYLKQGRQ